MKFSIKTEDFSSKFVVFDAEGLERYLVKNELNSVMRKLSIFDLADHLVCTVEKKFFSLRPTYEIYNQNHQLVLNVRKKLNLLHPHFIITTELEKTKFQTIGDYFGKNFSITGENSNDLVAQISRHNGYSIDIVDKEHDAAALIAVVIVIHLCCHLTKDE